MATTGFLFCPCIHTPCALRALVRPPMAVYGALPSALPVCLMQQAFSPRIALYHGNMTTFTSGANIHMSIRFTMVTR